MEEPATGDAHGEPVVLWRMDGAELLSAAVVLNSLAHVDAQS
jgi:uncharacterized protein GlcG (DUF336 family)